MHSNFLHSHHIYIFKVVQTENSSVCKVAISQRGLQFTSYPGKCLPSLLILLQYSHMPLCSNVLFLFGKPFFSFLMWYKLSMRFMGACR
ncbi:Uncharacterized protein APZ42_026703 [Daphnia magna]|uniref:Uncharacterized protein n=1 Tax=Daphnia magna TaxID=35525 RepID=A0A162DAL3_9CRUS|nr:Uncharacterized protein APZ42_026703 [Daphnia magna]